MENELQAFSNSLADIVDTVGQSVVRVDDGSRLTATGIIWSSDGLIVTTSHGTERDEDLKVERHDGTRLAATLVGRDPRNDVALLRVDAKELPTLTASSGGRVGELALVVARPGFIQNGPAGVKASHGIISARLPLAGGAVLNTDATFDFGFSGSALVDASGRLLGMANLALGHGQGSALSTSAVQMAVDDLLAGTPRARGFLGVRTQFAELTQSTTEAAGQETGLLVVHVEQGSAADAAGLMLGDTILGIDGEPTYDPRELSRILGAHLAGESIQVKFLRGGVLQVVAATLGVAAAESGDAGQRQRRGMGRGRGEGRGAGRGRHGHWQGYWDGGGRPGR